MVLTVVGVLVLVLVVVVCGGMFFFPFHWEAQHENKMDEDKSVFLSEPTTKSPTTASIPPVLRLFVCILRSTGYRWKTFSRFTFYFLVSSTHTRYL